MNGTRSVRSAFNGSGCQGQIWALATNDGVAESGTKPDGNACWQKGSPLRSGRCKSYRQHSSTADRQKICWFVKHPPISALVKVAIPVNRINVGNMHYANGKQQIAKTVSVDAGDIAAFNDLKAAGVECFRSGRPDRACCGPL